MKYFLELIIFLLLSQFLFSQSVVNTKHNLSAGGTGAIKSLDESEICIFCHTPHTSTVSGPLWNRNDPGANYILYNSSTVKATAGQPDGSSILCLSCHDGTIALGKLVSRKSEISFLGGNNFLTGKNSKNRKDLSHDHPISIEYNSALAAMNEKLENPTTLSDKTLLDKNGKVQCTSCHDAHRDSYHDFLKYNSEYSVLCFNCHDQNYWKTSSHLTSSAGWNGSGENPWSKIKNPYSTVAQNACANCHVSHNAESSQRLMNQEPEEKNCLICHSGSTADASKNISVQFNKMYRHNISIYFGIHDPNEPDLIDKKHIECVDCHNAHQSTNEKSTAPFAHGSLAGVRGIDLNGNSVSSIRFEYELCFRCHSDKPVTTSHTIRQIEQNNTRLEFSETAISSHPVANQGKNMGIDNLISPLSANSQIYCSSCHASDGKDSPAGPHGSVYPQILKYNYSKAENLTENSFQYELCYSCHARSLIISPTGNNFDKKIHYKHVVEVKTSCNTCHDPHGISSIQGISDRNSHLINFNISVVTSTNGKLYYQDNGNQTGSCVLTCHGKTHNPLSY